MGNYGPTEVAIAVDDTAFTPVNLTGYITEFNGFEVELMTEEITAFGDTVVENASVGVKKINDLVLKGFYNDNGSGPDVTIYGSTGNGLNLTSTRTIKVTYNAISGTSGTWRQHKIEAILVSYKVITGKGALTKFEATFRPGETSAFTYTGAGTSLT